MANSHGKFLVNSQIIQKMVGVIFCGGEIYAGDKPLRERMLKGNKINFQEAVNLFLMQ